MQLSMVLANLSIIFRSQQIIDLTGYRFRFLKCDFFPSYITSNMMLVSSVELFWTRLILLNGFRL